MDNTIKVEMGFMQRRLPWLVGGAMFLIFLVTMSRWITPGTAVALAKLKGWDWRPEVVAPLHVLLTWPLKWFPSGTQILALNLFEVICAAFALGLLARSVALLPHDRTKEQRQFERSDFSMLSIPSAWLPPVLAALVCGLQLNFWENAAASNGEMLDLLVFAYLVRCLLEFRLDHNERWLKKLAFVYGLAVVNNFAMIGFFPLFLLALVWIKWATFFNWRFVGRMVLWGCLGLSLYLLLPLVVSIRQPLDYTFSELLRGYWNLQRMMLMSAPRYTLVFLSFTSFLPVLFIGIRWPASFGDTSPTGQALTNLTIHVIHLLFLAACLYVTFDLEFSPRSILYGRMAALPLYYLGALSIGYCAGYVLLVFGVKPDPNAKSWQRPSLVRQLAGKALVVCVWLVLLGVPAGLTWKNYPKISARNSPALTRHAAVLADSLPSQGSVVLGDDATRLYALQAELQKRTPVPDHILVESVSLDFPAYHRFLLKRYGQRLTSLATNVPTGRSVDAYQVTIFLAELSRTLGMYYIQPSYGYFFESFYLKPHQAVYQMVLFTNNAITPPPLSASELSAQEDYWKKALAPEMASLKPAEDEPRVSKKSSRKAASTGLEREVQMVYSRALDHFGFEAQRAGDLKRAGGFFEMALQFNPHNLHAYINKDYNQRLQAGRPESLPPSTNILERTQASGLSLDQRLNLYGPPDEPSISEYLAQHFHSTTLYRQAGQWLERSLVFEPTNINRRLFLISEALHLGMADHVLSLIAELRAHPPVPLLPEDQLDLTRAEAWAHFSKGDLPTAERLLRAARQQFPDKSTPYSTLAEIYQATRGATNPVPTQTILDVYEDQLKVQPNNAGALGSISLLLINSGQHEKALPYLERALALKSDDASILFARGFCNVHLAQLTNSMNADRISMALADFLQVSSIDPKKYAAFWGIGECYRLKRNKSQAIIYYRKFIDAAPQDDPDVPLARRRIKELRDGF